MPWNGGKRSGVSVLSSLVPMLDSRTVPIEGKRVDPHYLSAGHKAWRAAVIARAGGRCQALEHGERCTKVAPYHRMFADHIVELRDNGNPFDPMNGQCLCNSHHTAKTLRARQARASSKA